MKQQRAAGRRHRQGGFTLLELIFVLVVAALVAIPIYSRFTESRTRAMITEDVNNLLALIGNTQERWSNEQDFANAANAAMIANNVVPPQMVVGGAITNRARGAVNCAPVNLTGVNDGLECSSANYSSEFCAAVAQKIDRAVRRVRIDGTVVKDIDAALNIAALGTACTTGAGAHIIQFAMAK